jgi:hypothetical protein
MARKTAEGIIINDRGDAFIARLREIAETIRFK